MQMLTVRPGFWKALFWGDGIQPCDQVFHTQNFCRFSQTPEMKQTDMQISLVDHWRSMHESVSLN